MNRREFIATAAAFPSLAAPKAPRKNQSETLVAALYKSLTPEQKSTLCFPFFHPLRSKVDANWHIVPQKISQAFNRDQQVMIGEIFRGLHNPEFMEKILYHIQEDAGGLENYSVALFGEPGGKFEFVLTGRHCTVRCDGDSVDGAAFGGPIMYGHQSGPNGLEPADHPKNVYWYQARRANEVFNALDGKQRDAALLRAAARAEAQNKTVAIRPKPERHGLPVADMTRDQRDLVEKVMSDLLLPFREQDVAEARKLIQARGGVNSLHMAFYKNLDIGNDGVWDVWQLEGDNMVWYFRGHPHVHTWVNITA
jgi:hypothetical protein